MIRHPSQPHLQKQAQELELELGLGLAPGSCNFQSHSSSSGGPGTIVWWCPAQLASYSFLISFDNVTSHGLPFSKVKHLVADPATGLPITRCRNCQVLRKSTATSTAPELTTPLPYSIICHPQHRRYPQRLALA